MALPIQNDAVAEPALASGTFAIGGDLPVVRLGYGTMRLPGPGVWGEPKDRPGALRVLRRAIELGVTLIDTADCYGPTTAEELVRDALRPYAEELVIATKAGLIQTGPLEWHACGRPEHLRRQAELSLRRLGLERIDLFQLHRLDPKVPLEEQIGLFAELQKEGKIRHIGLSEVSVDELRSAQKLAPIATVQNRYNVVERSSEGVLDYCEREGIGFIPWFPVAQGQLTSAGGPLDGVVEQTGATPAQVALAWLLRRSPVMLPIPGTSSVAHLEENIRAAMVELSNAQFAQLAQAALG
jgi:aryl-alcohol dehydrogenase-like predicted oxidoreductase